MGHKDLVSGFSFCQHAGQSHICVSSSSDGSVRFWDSSSKTLIREHAAHQVSPVLCPLTQKEVLCRACAPYRMLCALHQLGSSLYVCCAVSRCFFHIYMKWSNLLDETGPLTRSGERKLSIRARQDSVGCAAKTSSAAAL